MVKLAPQPNAKKALILGIIEVFKAFRLNPTQAHAVIDEVKQLLNSPSIEDTDKTRNIGQEVILRISVKPNELIEVESEVTTKIFPVVPKSVKL
ncbi:hypothetical protein [Nostoc sp. JL23]|uniref:hypothetical protein n=1 Tax=Nostoc sp. JL23 TaxID=2815394 RepID=UPI001DBB6622|nr:hypothetical protein [Nostoc sp. JL23]MBN3875205.1 hypothetical protein [Nostoc sp. JL23]